jgi:polyphosphate kinase
MPRNLNRRVEAVAPVDDPQLRQHLEQVLALYLGDTGAWHMQSDGSFQQQQQDSEEQLAQRELMRRWRGGLSGGGGGGGGG